MGVPGLGSVALVLVVSGLLPESGFRGLLVGSTVLVLSELVLVFMCSITRFCEELIFVKISV